MPVYDVAPETHTARRGFPNAQLAFTAAFSRKLSDLVDVGWYDTETHPESGCFALVKEGGALEDLVGEIIGVTRDQPDPPAPTFVYVIAALPVLDDLMLARRAFLDLGLLTHETLSCIVGVV